MTTDGTKPGWSSTAKGLVGAGLLAVAGFFGTAVMNVLSAPKDSVAYDLIQSLTGMLKTRDTPPPAPPVATAPAAPQAPKTESPKTQERPVAFIPQPAAPTSPETAPPPATVSPPPAAGPSPQAAAPDAASPAPGGIGDRMRQSAELARKIAAANATLAGSRVLSLNDRAEASLCGGNYRLEVTSVAAGKAAVALRGQGADPVTLTVGQPRELGAGCRVELLLAMEDIDNRRAQLRETKTR